jgi:hypothetical protein
MMNGNCPFLENDDRINPNGTADRLRSELGTATDMKQISELEAAIAKSLSPESAAVAHANRRVLMIDFERVRLSLVELMKESIALVQSYQAEARAAEEAFWKSQELPYERTMATRRFDSDLNQLREMLTAWSVPPNTLPNPHSTPLATLFGAV